MTVSKDRCLEARIAMHGRILRCSFGGNPVHCPLHETRKLPVEERIKWLESQNDEELIELYRAHRACMKCKLEAYDKEY